MSRFGSTSYNPTGSSGNSSDDYKDREAMLLDKYAIIEANLAEVGVYEGNFGMNIILNMDDAVVREGVLTERVEQPNGEADNKLKVMGWDTWYDRNEDMELVPFEEDEKVDLNGIGRRETETHGGDKYKYSIEEGVLEGRDEPVEIGDRELWLGNGKKARTIAKVLSSKGHDIIDEDNKRDDREWLDAENELDFALREELEGRRIMFWFEKTTLSADEIDDLDEDVTFTDAVILDAETEAPITIPNDTDGTDRNNSSGAGGTDSDNSDSIDGGVDGADGEDNEPDFPKDVDEMVDMFARTGQTDPDMIGNSIRDAAPDDYEVDMDAVVSAIERRA